MAEKAKLEFDGEEIIGFVSMTAVEVTTDSIEIPEFRRKRLIENGIKKINTFDLVYECRRGTDTLKFFRDWYFNNEVKDVVKIRTDAHGSEFARTLLPSCVCLKWHEPDVDLATPKYSQIQTTIAPWDITPIDGE
jgi:hypothetical protein